MERIFVDTDVLLDVIIEREPFFHDSRAIWEKAERHEVEAHVAAISFNNVHYLVRRLKGLPEALCAVTNVRQVFQTSPVGEQIIDHALSLAFKEFEDAVQYACAQNVGARWLLTRNLDDFPATGKPTAITPAAFLAKAPNR